MAELDGKPAEQFLEALKRRNLEGKRALIADLRRRQTDKAIEILIDVLRDDSWYLRELASDALGEAGEKAVPQLLAVLDSGLWFSRAAAVRTLGKIGHVPNLATLVELLDDANATVRGAAWGALADFVDRSQTDEVARAIRSAGPARVEELKRQFIAAHESQGRAVAILLEERPGAAADTPPAPPEAD